MNLSPVNGTINKTQIMIVEDEAIVRQDLEEFLTENGYEVIATADTGEDAVIKAEACRPDLIFMDVNLKSDFDGVQAAEQIMRMMFVPIIYLTAFSDTKTQERVTNTSPFGYVLKPFDERELRAGIELALQRARFERELDESRRWYETTLRSIGDAVLTTDKEGKITYLNPVAENLLGVSLDEARDCDISDVVRLFDEVSREPIENPVISVLQNRKTAFLSSNSMLARLDGEEIAVDDSAAMILDEKDETLGVVAVFRDAREHREANQRLVQAKKMEVIGVLAGGIAHNFNNMMLGAMGNLEFAMRGDLEDATRNRLTTSYNACRKAAELTNKLLSFARGQILQPKIVELSRVVRDIEGLGMSLLIGKANLTLNLTERSIYINVDVINLEQAILNLCLNSVSAMSDGGSLIIETKCETIVNSFVDATGTVIAPGTYGVVCVKDSGTGMSEETMSKMFVPFFTTKAEGKGTGLGLPSVDGFVKQSGGYVIVKSKPDAGTSIFLYFPMINN